jgi:hypothetical protein
MGEDLIVVPCCSGAAKLHSLRAHQEAAEAFGAECIVVKPSCVGKKQNSTLTCGCPYRPECRCTTMMTASRLRISTPR